MKILITGSHFTPAQATIEKLQEIKNLEIVYLGRRYTREGDKTPSVESQVLPHLGIKFIPLIAGRLQRAFTIYTIPSLLKIPIGFLQSFYFVLKERPDVVLSFGGYISVPVVISSYLLSIPVIIHEQTLISGLSNTLSSYFASKIAVSFPNNESFDKDKTILTGNPIRSKLLENTAVGVDPEIKNLIEVARKLKLPLILITGGNQGSHVINLAVFGVLENLSKIACVVHHSGDSKFKDFEKLAEKKTSLKDPDRYLVRKWIEGKDFGFLLRKIDLAVSRAGINTLSELAYFGVPALVVPILYLYKDEQNVNAKFFEKLGLVKTLPQSRLTPKRLLSDIKLMLNDLNHFKERAKRAKSVVIPDAAQRLALETLILAKK